MQRFIMPDALTEDDLLLPELHVPEQDELLAYLNADFREAKVTLNLNKTRRN